MEKTKKHFAWLLLAATLLFVFPPQLLHELTCHSDTNDFHSCTSGVISVEAQHQHCDALQLYFSPYHSSVAYLPLTALPVYFLNPLDEVSSPATGFPLPGNNRAPPAV